METFFKGSRMKEAGTKKEKNAGMDMRWK